MIYAKEGKLISWIPFDLAYEFSKNLTAVVYSFGLFDKIPKESFPHENIGTFYIGMSGGLDEPYVIDKKDKKTERFMIQTAVYKRFKDHKCNGKLTDDWVVKQIESGKKLYVSFIIPPDEKNGIRSWISCVESELIHLYQKNFGTEPKLNLAEKMDFSTKDPNSFSQKKLKEIRNTVVPTLDEFFV